MPRPPGESKATPPACSPVALLGHLADQAAKLGAALTHHSHRRPASFKRTRTRTDTHSPDTRHTPTLTNTHTRQSQTHVPNLSTSDSARCLFSQKTDQDSVTISRPLSLFLAKQKKDPAMLQGARPAGPAVIPEILRKGFASRGGNRLRAQDPCPRLTGACPLRPFNPQVSPAGWDAARRGAWPENQGPQPASPTTDAAPSAGSWGSGRPPGSALVPRPPRAGVRRSSDTDSNAHRHNTEALRQHNGRKRWK